ncbi:MAG TPA: replication-associated recombination protein A [Phycisphaerales bacterium]|nr:replication-associated recombination protein A [Phycisphaerales bacterium]
MSDLWAEQRAVKRQSVAPLAVRLRPQSLTEFVGQEHFLAPGMLLNRMLSADRLSSMIFYGPPGTGKTTLAEIIASHTKRHFEQANAALVGVKDIRTILDAAARRLENSSTQTILFLDEIHRFARNQQDVLLNDVEAGIVTLIGATTENPYFSVNSALVSRSTVFQFEALTNDHIISLLRRALTHPRAFPGLTITVADDALHHWARISDGDARRALTALELAVLSAPTPKPNQPIHINLDAAQQSIQAKALVYDGTGDAHYDLASALIKSMRGSDPDASVYWLARMLQAGEDPRFIARRIAILASEDIGNADPHAISVAASAWELTERVGMPECQLILSQAVIYMACAPKSNACTLAIGAASEEVRTGRTIPVPRFLRDAHYQGSASLGNGQNYKYPHDSADAYVDQDYLGVDRQFYHPTAHGFEAQIAQRLADLKSRARPDASPQPPPRQ